MTRIDLQQAESAEGAPAPIVGARRRSTRSGDDYKGVITPTCIARRMLEIDREDPSAQLYETA